MRGGSRDLHLVRARISEEGENITPGIRRGGRNKNHFIAFEQLDMQSCRWPGILLSEFNVRYVALVHGENV